MTQYFDDFVKIFLATPGNSTDYHLQPMDTPYFADDSVFFLATPEKFGVLKPYALSSVKKQKQANAYDHKVLTNIRKSERSNRFHYCVLDYLSKREATRKQRRCKIIH